MHAATYAAFKDELEKLGWHAAAEIAGLGTLAAPTIQKMRGKPMSERASHAAEIGGLGILAAPAAHSMYKAVKKGGLAALKHASVDPSLVGGALSLFKKADVDLWNPSTGAVHSGIGGTRGSNLGTNVSGVASHAPKTKFTLDHLKSAYAKAGLKPGVKSVARVVGKAVHASINKEAFLKELFQSVKPAAKKAFTPSFAGHSKALGLGTNVAKSGVETIRRFNPLTQALSQSKSIAIPGLK
jgi:hypothetical protein